MSIEKRISRGTVRYYARYRQPDGAQRTKVFSRKVDAERFLTTVESAKLHGTYVDPSRGRITLGEWADTWLDAQTHLKPSTHERYAGILRAHVMPRWRRVPLAAISHAQVQAWISDLATKHSAATVRKVHGVLLRVLALAVKDHRLTSNPAADVNLPRIVHSERQYLTHQQVAALADACADPLNPSKHRRLTERSNDTYRLIVLFLSYTGVRFGEMAALRVEQLDLDRRRAAIVRSVTPVQGRGLVWGTPKTHERRDVPVPRFLVAELAEHIKDRAPDDLVFPAARSGGPIRVAVFRIGAFDDAAERIGVPDLRPHDLRHTAASLAIAAGADVKVVQQMLGHASAAMTLDRYGHLFGDRLDEVADALDAAFIRTQDPNPTHGLKQQNFP
jgi:integrase